MHVYKQTKRRTHTKHKQRFMPTSYTVFILKWVSPLLSPVIRHSSDYRVRHRHVPVSLCLTFSNPVFGFRLTCLSILLIPPSHPKLLCLFSISALNLLLSSHRLQLILPLTSPNCYSLSSSSLLFWVIFSLSIFSVTQEAFQRPMQLCVITMALAAKRKFSG